MPELPEVETVRRGLNQATLHQPIHGGEVLLDRTIAYPVSGLEFLAGLNGVAIAHWHRRGKYLLAELEQQGEGERGRGEERKLGKIGRETPHSALSDTVDPTLQTAHPTPAGWLGIHLRMTGQLLWLNPAEPVQIHTRVRLFFAGDRELRFVDQRTFGQMWWVPPDQPPDQIITGLQRLGPEPLSDDFTLDYLCQVFSHRRRPVKNALLDQAIVAGIGNIYADEALFLSGIHPETLCTSLSRPQVETLRTQVIQVLQDSIGVGGTTIRTFLNVEGVNGNYRGQARVYGRDGKACHTCGSEIQRIRLAGRSAHFCPICQGVGR